MEENSADAQEMVSAMVDMMLKDPEDETDNNLAKQIETVLITDATVNALPYEAELNLQGTAKESQSSGHRQYSSIDLEYESRRRSRVRLEKPVIGFVVLVFLFVAAATGFWIKRLITEDGQHDVDAAKLKRRASRWNVRESKASVQQTMGSHVPGLQFARCDPPDVVFVFTLPEFTQVHEESQFSRLNHEALLKDSLLVKDLKSTSAHFWHSRTLKAARQNAADLILRMFCPNNGFKVKCFVSVDYDELFLCLALSKKKAVKVADEAEYNLQLDRAAIPSLGIHLPDAEAIVPAYVKCDAEFLDYLHEHQTATGEKSVLRHVDHIRLTYDLVTDYIDLNTWQREGLVKLVMFPHSRPELLWLQQNWSEFSRLLSFEVPLDAIRDYYGEEAAFYFGFVQFSAIMLTVLSVISLVLYAYEFCLGTFFDSKARMIYAVTIIVWTTLFVELWKRQEAVYANRWGTDVADVSTVKPQESVHFKGELHPNPVDVSMKLLMANPTQKFYGEVISAVSTALFSILVLAGVGSNLYLRGVLLEQGNDMGAIYCSLLLTVQMKIVDKVWGYLSEYLTSLENHQFVEDFSNSRCTKLMLVKFPNTFAALFYIAFGQAHVEGCPKGGCMNNLCINMITIYATYVSFGFMDLLLPYLQLKYAIQKELAEMRVKDGGDTELALLEAQAKMAKYEADDLFEDYLQIFFPLFFIMLFGVSFPLAPVLSLICCLCQTRTDAWKLVHAHQRPFPAKATGIGSARLAVLEAVGLVSVIVNWGLIVFLTKPFEKYSTMEQCVAFFAGQQVLMLLMLLIKHLTPDIPQSVTTERARQAHQKSKLLSYKVPEDNMDADRFAGPTDFSAFGRLEPADKYFERMMI
jgi:hypothetical protein